jgi:hypothetical protein
MSSTLSHGLPTIRCFPKSLDVIAVGKDQMPSFEIVEWDGASQVYCNYTDDFKVMQNGVELECGHQRQLDEPR